MFVDSHAHLTDPTLFEQVDVLLSRARQARVKAIVNICTDLLSLERGLVLADAHPDVYLAAATTPHDVEKEGAEVFDQIATCARSGKLKAIGETGLDYYYEHSNREIQKEFLIRYFHLALECHLPVVIHCRDAFSDFFKVLDSFSNPPKGVLHCFTGTMEDAEELVRRGWMVSFSGIVTFKKSVELQRIAAHIPLENLLIETDSPYLAPQKYRGRQNEPSFLVETAHFIAALRSIPVEELGSITTANALRLFHI